MDPLTTHFLSQGSKVTLKTKTVEFSVKQRTKTLPHLISQLEDLKEAACSLLKAEIKESLPRPLRLRLMGRLDACGTKLSITQFRQPILLNHACIGVRLSSLISEKEQASPKKRTVLDDLFTANCKKVKVGPGDSEPVANVAAKSSKQGIEDLSSVSCSVHSSAFSSSEQETAGTLETEEEVSMTIY